MNAKITRSGLEATGNTEACKMYEEAANGKKEPPTKPKKKKSRMSRIEKAGLYGEKR